MGAITVTGFAKRSVAYDRMIITVTFHAWAKTTDQVLTEIESQSEKFLQILKDEGFGIKSIQMKNTDLDEKKNNGSDKSFDISVSGSKSLLLDSPLNMKVINGIQDVIKENKMDASFSVSFYLSDTEELHRELLKEAIEDSRKKAEIIAESVGEKVIGIEEAQNGERIMGSIKKRGGEENYYDIMTIFSRRKSLSAELAALQTEEKEIIEIVWTIA